MQITLSCYISLVFIIVHSHYVFSSKPLCHPDEKSYLLSFLTKNSPNKSTDCCSWRGVECDETTGHVIGLGVDSLDGNVTENSSLFSLRHLQRLTLHGGKSLSISEAALKSLARNFTDLKELEVSSVSLSSVPLASLTNLSTTLTRLVLNNTGLKGEVFDHISNFSKLRELSIAEQGYGISISEAGIKSLARNSIRLEELMLINVDMSSVPLVSLTNLSSSLTHLSLQYCLLNGELPDNFFLSFPKLKCLDLARNNLSGRIPDFCSSNSLSGALPITPYLNVFLASKNRFSGEIPTSICNLKFARVLDLSFNSLIGKMPQCLGRLSKHLSVLDLRRNKLRGNISTIFAQGSNLRSINLNGNLLEGMVPMSLVNCSNKLEVLDLGNNLLSDTFPHWLGSFPELQVLVLRGNKLHGSIRNPETGLSFPKLRIMDLSHNEFAGALPKKYFENFKAMQAGTGHVEMSYMGETYYKDSVTVTMKGFEFELVKIQTIFTTIDFSSNNFSGEIPEVLGELVSLKGLNLSHNTLAGNVPPSLGKLSNLEWLDLSSNELVGKIPTELASLPWLAILKLSHNHLEGPIPHGPQFDTFGNDSFEGNLNLCGFPLSKPCGDPHLPQPYLEREGHSSIAFIWKIVMMGYASGLVIGISIGYMLLYGNGKLRWVPERIMEDVRYKTSRATRPKKKSSAQRSKMRA